MSAEIVIAVVTSFTTITGGLIAGYLQLKVKRLELEKKNAPEHGKSDGIVGRPPLNAGEVVSDFSRFNALRLAVEEVFDHTEFGRFCIFFAVNGKEAVNTVHLVFEMQTDKDRQGSLDHFIEVTADDQYKTMLKEIERSGSAFVDVTALKPCALKAINMRHELFHEDFHFIARKPLSDNADMLLFCSWGKYGPKYPDPSARAFVAAKIGSVRKAVMGYVGKI